MLLQMNGNAINCLNYKGLAKRHHPANDLFIIQHSFFPMFHVILRFFPFYFVVAAT